MMPINLLINPIFLLHFVELLLYKINLSTVNFMIYQRLLKLIATTRKTTILMPPMTRE